MTAQHFWDLQGPGSGPTRDHLHSSFRNWPPENLKEPVSPPNAWPEWPGVGAPPGVGGIAEPGPELRGQCRLRCWRKHGSGAGLRAQEAAVSPALGAPGLESESRGCVSAVGLFPGEVSGQERREGGRLL